VAAERGVTEIALSLSFTHDVATAMALLVTDEVRPKPREERDPQAELLSSFKQARTVIDELERLQGDISSTMA
jgi:holo-[acyl-carrier protein] synthase